MKKIIILFSIAVFLIGFIVIYKYYYNKVVKINVYEISKYNQSQKTYLTSLTNPKSIDIVVESIKHGKKINGTLDVLPANYIVELYYTTNRRETIYLWLTKEYNTSSMYMYVNKTSTGYTIPKQYTSKLQQVLFYTK
ncbi:hypothetical protein [Clostridium pasteurianum]|uniref:YhfM-like domain-containing protein n=1 Tax=Clostridium pasteurianum BC1 TaxID=86416 RepID=R4K6R6_CLOPA|nr:hypothetical protein [Clostridium pasteurianum]AGK96204.1 hypothetical protein Clopa_1214 [Clostridium pasteurianum BC1]